jgi:hypothetical protein
MSCAAGSEPHKHVQENPSFRRHGASQNRCADCSAGSMHHAIKIKITATRNLPSDAVHIDVLGLGGVRLGLNNHVRKPSEHRDSRVLKRSGVQSVTKRRSCQHATSRAKSPRK